MKESLPEVNFIPEEKLLKDYTPEIRARKRQYFDELRKLWTRREFNSLIEMGYQAIDILPKYPEGNGDKEISGIYMLLGSAIWEIEKNTEKTLPLAKLAVQFDRTNKGAMWLLRECNAKYSDDSKYLRCLIKGNLYVKSADEYKVHTFHSVYGVVAETSEDAMKYIREYERNEICDNLELKSFEDIGLKPELPQGIYAVSELIA